MACLHLLRSTLDCAIYVDTGFSYPETAALVEYARTIIPVHVVVSDRKAQNELEGLPADVVPIDWTRLGHTITGPKPVLIQSYLGCCYESISKPLLDYAIRIGVKELVYGQRDDEGHKSPARDGTVVSGEGLVLVEGVPLLIYGQLESSKSKVYDPEDNEFELESDDAAIVTVERTDKAWQFVIIGAMVGETCVHVVVDGDEMECIPAQVIAQ